MTQIISAPFLPVRGDSSVIQPSVPPRAEALHSCANQAAAIRAFVCLGFIDDDPGVVPIIEPLRRILDAIKPETASGWMFPNTIGGAIDLDNLADRLIQPMLKQMV